MSRHDHTGKLYMTHPDVNQANAMVTSVEDRGDGTLKVKLNQTIFHPKGGGQPADEGTISGVPVLSVEKDYMDDDHYEVAHIVDEFDNNIDNIAEGAEVELEIEYDRRVHLSLLHTVGHLLSNIAETDLGLEYHKCSLDYTRGAEKNVYLVFLVGALAEDKRAAAAAKLTDDELVALKDSAMEAVAANPAIVEGEDEHDGRRTIGFEGYKPWPCGGTHMELGRVADITLFSSKSKKEKIDGVKQPTVKVYFDVEYDMGVIGEGETLGMGAAV